MVKRIVVDARRFTEIQDTNIIYIDGSYTTYDLNNLIIEEVEYYRNNSSISSYDMNEWDAYYILKNVYGYDDSKLIRYAFPIDNIFDILLNEINNDNREEIVIDITEYNIE